MRGAHRLANTYNHLGNALFEQGSIDAALDNYEKAMKFSQPNSLFCALSCYNLSRYYGYTKDYKQAMNHCRVAINIFLECPGNHRSRIQQAKEQYSKMLSLFPDEGCGIPQNPVLSSQLHPSTYNYGDLVLLNGEVLIHGDSSGCFLNEWHLPNSTRITAHSNLLVFMQHRHGSCSYELLGDYLIEMNIFKGRTRDSSRILRNMRDSSHIFYCRKTGKIRFMLHYQYGFINYPPTHILVEEDNGFSYYNLKDEKPRAARQAIDANLLSHVENNLSSFSPNCRYIVLEKKEREKQKQKYDPPTFFVYDLVSNEVVKVMTLCDKGHYDFMTIRWAPDSAYMAVRYPSKRLPSPYGVVCKQDVYKLPEGQKMLTCDTAPYDDIGSDNFSHDGTRLVILDPSGRLAMYNLRSEKEIKLGDLTYRFRRLDIKWSPDDSYLVVRSDPYAHQEESALNRLYEVPSKADEPLLEIQIPTSYVPHSWSPDSQYLACRNRNHSSSNQNPSLVFEIWNPRTLSATTVQYYYHKYDRDTNFGFLPRKNFFALWGHYRICIRDIEQQGQIVFQQLLIKRIVLNKSHDSLFLAAFINEDSHLKVLGLLARKETIRVIENCELCKSLLPLEIAKVIVAYLPPLFVITV